MLTRRVAREQAGRDLFANPYATVAIANVDVYDRFPYLETRQFEVVSDHALEPAGVRRARRRA